MPKNPLSQKPNSQAPSQQNTNPTNTWPIYFKDRLILGNPDSSIGVVTLWLPKENAADYLDPKTFSVCGQLYTKGGINYILRNILANPRIRHLVMCGMDRQGSGEALKKFFDAGIVAAPSGDKAGQEASGESVVPWKIKGDEKALIDGQIPLEYLNLIRENVSLTDMRDGLLEDVAEKVVGLHEEASAPAPGDAGEVSKVVREAANASQDGAALSNKVASKNITKSGFFCDPIIFPEPQKAPVETYPSDASVFKIRRDYISEAWLDALKTVTRFGRKIPGMYGPVGQVANLSIVIEKEDPDDPVIADYFNFDKKQLDLYYEGFFSRNKAGEEIYTYGERIFDWDGVDQGGLMVEKLQRFEFDRGALAVLWKPHKDNFPPDDVGMQHLGQTKRWRVPCLVMILGQVVDGKFDMTAVFRNNDVFGAWPLNAFALRKFQKRIAGEIGRGLGSLTTIAHIGEIYELNWEAALRVVAENYRLERFCQQDPRSYYIVELEGTDIVVTFYSPDGSRELGNYRKDGRAEKAARDLSLEILADLLVGDMGAACDLGRQLAKAEAAVKLGLRFEQDKELA